MVDSEQLNHELIKFSESTLPIEDGDHERLPEHAEANSKIALGIANILSWKNTWLMKPEVLANAVYNRVSGGVAYGIADCVKLAPTLLKNENFRRDFPTLADWLNINFQTESLLQAVSKLPEQYSITSTRIELTDQPEVGEFDSDTPHMSPSKPSSMTPIASDPEKEKRMRIFKESFPVDLESFLKSLKTSSLSSNHEIVKDAVSRYHALSRARSANHPSIALADLVGDDGALHTLYQDLLHNSAHRELGLQAIVNLLNNPESMSKTTQDPSLLAELDGGYAAEPVLHAFADLVEDLIFRAEWDHRHPLPPTVRGIASQREQREAEKHEAATEREHSDILQKMRQHPDAEKYQPIIQAVEDCRNALSRQKPSRSV